MEDFSQSGDGRGGLWNKPKVPQYSKKTQDMLTSMMQELRFTNRQKKQVNECLKKGAALPMALEPSSAPRPQPKTPKPVQKHMTGRPQKRTAACCQCGNSYVREQFRPAPMRDLEKEKRRLQNILATGKEEPTDASSQNVPARQNQDVLEQKDRYQEVLDEIEERRQFLIDMFTLGRKGEYINIVSTEISQKIRELGELDKARRRKKETGEGETSD